MSSNNIWFIFKNTSIFNEVSLLNNKPEILLVNFLNHEKYLVLIDKTIKKFNSEITWDEMWDLNQAKKRLMNNHVLYLLVRGDDVIGHVWYYGGFLYNAFVSKQRINGESQWFIQETMKDRFNNGYLNISLYTEKWNIRAIKFWLKIGFTELDSIDP